MSTSPNNLSADKKALAVAEAFFGLKKRTEPKLPRCKHGVYDPHGDQHHCTVCNPVPIPADAPTTKAKGSSGVVLVTAGDAKLRT